MYPSTARALWRQHDVGLTVTEYKIVRLLVSGVGIRSYRTIYDTVHYDGFVAGSALGYTINARSLMKRIRRKFLAVDPGSSTIKNVHKIGYRWLASTDSPLGRSPLARWRYASSPDGHEWPVPPCG